MQRKGTSLNSIAAPGFPLPDQSLDDLPVKKLEQYDYKGTNNMMFKQSSYDTYSRAYKRARTCNEKKDFHSLALAARVGIDTKIKEKRSHPSVKDYSDPSSIVSLLEGLESNDYGSVTKDFEDVHNRWMRITLEYPSVSSSCLTSAAESLSNRLNSYIPLLGQGEGNHSLTTDIIDVDVDESANNQVLAIEDAHNHGTHGSEPFIPWCNSSASQGKISDKPCGNLELKLYKKGMDEMPVVIIDSDDEDGELQNHVGHASWGKHELCNSEVWQGSQRQSFHILEKQVSQGNCEVGFPLDDNVINFESNRQSSCIYQKVVLSAANENTLQDTVAIDGAASESFSLFTQKFGNNAEKKHRRRRTKVNAHGSHDKGLQGLNISMEAKQNKIGRSTKMKVEKVENVTNGVETNSNAEQEADGTAREEVAQAGLASYSLLEEFSSFHKDDTENDGLANIWNEMTLALEFSKDHTLDGSVPAEEGEECEHSCILKDDLGYVCRICGVIQKSIETIFDYQWIKGSKTTRTYSSNSRSTRDADEAELNHLRGYKDSEHDLFLTELTIHPRHMKQMKPHQLEGFNFLLRNLITDKPSGCILAHAPGSGKTFMIISFIHSFLVKYPHARPLVVLPKGILPTWKKEFRRWQIEDIPLIDFYSSKADSRSQQLEVLNNWVDNKSILFLGYKQFSNIICGSKVSNIEAACQQKLLNVPTLLILDEGHTPRNDNTDVLHSLSKVQTPRKVVLSGTLFQNHVQEVFNILNLVRPKFLKLEESRAIVRRVKSKVHISGGSRRHCRTAADTTFFDLVEETLQNDNDFKTKISVIQDLREMTKNVLHYYKGDFLEELPGLVDFTVLLSLTTKQKNALERFRKMDKFKRRAVMNSIYIHPNLKDTAENVAGGEKGVNLSDEKLDRVVQKADVKDGVKAKFFLNILKLSVSAGEKLLVFSQYLLPLKFLERLLIRVRGWSPGKEIFMISGDSNTEHREWSMDQFNNSPDAKVLFGSIKACGEGISLVGASRVVILDVHLNPSVTRQAIGRAFRPGQLKKVFTYRLVAADSSEEDDHLTSSRKELISKMWFEWSDFCSHSDFDMEEVDINSCEDSFLESSILSEDVKLLYRR